MAEDVRRRCQILLRLVHPLPFSSSPIPVLHRLSRCSSRGMGLPSSPTEYRSCLPLRVCFFLHFYTRSPDSEKLYLHSLHSLSGTFFRSIQSIPSILVIDPQQQYSVPRVHCTYSVLTCANFIFLIFFSSSLFRTAFILSLCYLVFLFFFLFFFVSTVFSCISTLVYCTVLYIVNRRRRKEMRKYSVSMILPLLTNNISIHTKKKPISSCKLSLKRELYSNATLHSFIDASRVFLFSCSFLYALS